MAIQPDVYPGRKTIKNPGQAPGRKTTQDPGQAPGPGPGQSLQDPGHLPRLPPPWDRHWLRVYCIQYFKAYYSEKQWMYHQMILLYS